MATYLQCSNSHVITPEGNSKMKREEHESSNKERCIFQTQKVQNKSATLLRTYSTSTQIDTTSYIKTSDTSLRYVAPTQFPSRKFDVRRTQRTTYAASNKTTQQLRHKTPSTNYVKKLHQRTTSQNSVNKKRHKTPPHIRN